MSRQGQKSLSCVPPPNSGAQQGSYPKDTLKRGGGGANSAVVTTLFLCHPFRVCLSRLENKPNERETWFDCQRKKIFEFR